MKMILAGVAFATILASPVSAQSASHEGTRPSRIYLKHGQSDVDYRDPYLPAQSQPTPNPDPTKQWPCSTAPDFCPNFHGDPD
jgi:hypothetical protein